MEGIRGQRSPSFGEKKGRRSKADGETFGVVAKRWGPSRKDFIAKSAQETAQFGRREPIAFHRSNCMNSKQCAGRRFSPRRGVLIGRHKCLVKVSAGAADCRTNGDDPFARERGNYERRPFVGKGIQKRGEVPVIGENCA